MGPGPPPLGPWGASRGVPGGENNPQLKVWEVTVLDFFIGQNHVVVDVDFWPYYGIGLDLGTLLGLIFDRFGVLIGQSWS